MENIYIYILKSKLLFTLDNFSSNLPFCFVAPKTLIKSKKRNHLLSLNFYLAAICAREKRLPLRYHEVHFNQSLACKAV